MKTRLGTNFYANETVYPLDQINNKTGLSLTFQWGKHLEGSYKTISENTSAELASSLEIPICKDSSSIKTLWVKVFMNNGAEEESYPIWMWVNPQEQLCIAYQEDSAVEKYQMWVAKDSPQGAALIFSTRDFDQSDTVVTRPWIVGVLEEEGIVRELRFVKQKPFYAGNDDDNQYKHSA